MHRTWKLVTPRFAVPRGAVESPYLYGCAASPCQGEAFSSPRSLVLLHALALQCLESGRGAGQKVHHVDAEVCGQEITVVEAPGSRSVLAAADLGLAHTDGFGQPRLTLAGFVQERCHGGAQPVCQRRVHAHGSFEDETFSRHPSVLLSSDHTECVDVSRDDEALEVTRRQPAGG